MASTPFASHARSPSVAVVIPRDERTPALFAKAVACQRAGRLERAVSLYARILRREPDLPEVHGNLGAALARLGRMEQATAAFRRAAELAPDDPDKWCRLAVALKTCGELDEAERAFGRALALDPDHADALAGLGAVLSALGRSIEGAVVLGRAITLAPGNAGAYNDLGLALKQAGRLAEAARVAERAIRLAPRRTSYYLNLAEVRSFTADDPYVKALEDLATDLEALPIADRVHLHFALAKAYDDMGRFDDAFAQLLAANGLKRRLIAYDEAATLDQIDCVRDVFTPELIAARAGGGEPSRLPVFIVGMPRSGTTLVEQILASHPTVFGAGELRLFDKASGAVRDRLPGAPGFSNLVRRMENDDFRALGRFYLAALKQHAPDAARITDKMPSNFIFAGLIHLALPDAVIIHTVRDPLDTCLSCFSKQFTEAQAHTYDLAELGRYFGRYRALMAHWRRVLPPGRVLDVHYEDVVDDVEGAARRILAHCGLDWDARCLDFHRTERSVQTASAAQVRKPIYRDAIARWRRYERFLGPLMAELEKSEWRNGE